MWSALYSHLNIRLITIFYKPWLANLLKRHHIKFSQKQLDNFRPQQLLKTSFFAQYISHDMISCFFVWIQNRFRWQQPTLLLTAWIWKYYDTIILEIVEGADAFEMLMIVILEQLVANFWGKIFCLRDPFSFFSKKKNSFEKK